MVNSVLLASKRSHSAKRPRSRTQLQPQVPQFLRETANGIFERLLGFAIAEEKEQIDIGVGKEPAAPEASGGYEAEIRRLGFIGRDEIAPKPRQDVFYQPGALRDGSAPVAGGFKLPLDARRFVVDGTP